MKKPLTIRLLRPLPITISGGLTTWTIDKGYTRKGSNLEIFAACRETGEILTLLKGRESYVINAMARGLTAQPGTTAYKIFRRLVRLGLAEVVTNSDHL